MTQDRTFKRLVRERMAQTGESYMQARAKLLEAQRLRAVQEHAVIAEEDVSEQRERR